MYAFARAALEDAHRRGGRLYHEFLRRGSMSVGLYLLPAGSVDPQRPHGEDEVYVVTRGRARFRVEGEDREVGPGDVLFVPAGADHRFHAVAEDLHLVVVFAPPEGTAGR